MSIGIVSKGNCTCKPRQGIQVLLSKLRRMTPSERRDYLRRLERNRDCGYERKWTDAFTQPPELKEQK